MKREETGLPEFSQHDPACPQSCSLWSAGERWENEQLVHSLFGTGQQPPLGSLDMRYLARESSVILLSA